MMKLYGVGAIKRRLIYWAVRTFGRLSFRKKTPKFATHITTMIKLLLLFAALISASCAGLTVGLANEALDASYSAKGGLVVMPKLPPVIQVIEPAK